MRHEPQRSPGATPHKAHRDDAGLLGVGSSSSCMFAYPNSDSGNGHIICALGVEDVELCLQHDTHTKEVQHLKRSNKRTVAHPASANPCYSPLLV